MTYQPREGVDAKTREGRRVTCIRKDYPSLFEYPISGRTPNGTLVSYAGDGKYSIGSTHPNDLVSDWEETKDEINRRYECNGIKPDLPYGTILTVWNDTCHSIRSDLAYNMVKNWPSVTHYLIESYPKAKGWVNVYKKPNGVVTTSIVYKTKELAEGCTGENRIDCVEIEYTP